MKAQHSRHRAAVAWLRRGRQAQQTVTINIGSSHPEANIWAYAMKNVFQPEVDRILEGERRRVPDQLGRAYGGTLYRFTDTREAVRDGIVDVGMVGTVWEGSDDALAERDLFHALRDRRPRDADRDLRRADRGAARAARQLGRAEHGPPVVADHRQLRHLRQLRDQQRSPICNNRKINAPGTSANWLQGTGATPLDGALTTYYTDIQTGVSEGALSFASGILPTRVYEVAPYLTRVGIGAMYFGGIAANKASSKAMPEAVQEAFREAGRETSRATASM
jgi:C4-dicarboxylate-binding protein DctP